MPDNIDQLSINTIRFLAIDAIQKANSGHPGMPMGCAPIAYTLYTKFMKFNPANPKWLNRDRFVLSAGHGSMLLYSTLHLCGFDVSLDEIKKFRQWESITPGHPEFGLTSGVETTTGPLGQGFANAVGMAITQEYLAEMFNRGNHKILDHYIYGICSDGDLMEGVSHESASLAGHLKLGKLIFFYDDNNITIDGSTSLSYSENTAKRFESYGWQILDIDDVNDLGKIDNAVKLAQAETSKPTLIITKTHIGFGSPNKQDTSGVHGSPLGEEEIILTKKNLGWKSDESFFIPDEVKAHFETIIGNVKTHQDEWDKRFEKYKNEYPDDAELFLSMMSGNYSTDWKNKLPSFTNHSEKIATRSASGKVLNTIASSIPSLIGGSADLAPSNNTILNEIEAFTADNRGGRNFHFGIREHGMAGILNGMAMYGGVIPYGATFLVFSDYMRPSIRLAALSAIKVIYVFTHDSIGLGEDGPTHQPVEHLAALRAIPGLLVLRPADANETVKAWEIALEHEGGPVALILTRQKLSIINRDSYADAEGVKTGAYIIKNTNGKPDIIIMASGSEVEISLEAAERLETVGIKARVVSFPCMELFEQQDNVYKEMVLLANVKIRLSVEAGIAENWHKYTGRKGSSISIESFGASAPANILFEKYGITVDNIVKTSKNLLNKLADDCC
ncbi:transketolase [Bacteroidota bacterium]